MQDRAVHKQAAQATDSSRRRLLKAGIIGSVAAGFCALSVPFGYGQDPDIYPEIPVGTATNPVTLDGKVTSEEYYSDCVDNPYRASHSPLPEPVHLYVKDDGTWTHFGVDSLLPAKATNPHGGYLSLHFDTKGKGGRLEEGIYTLGLGFRGSYAAYEKTVQNLRIGVLFGQKFRRHRDYDWKSSIGPSPLSDTPHRQFEVQILSSILREHGSTINFMSGYNDGNGTGVFIQGQEGNRSWARMSYKDVPVPELPLGYLALLTSVGSGTFLLHRAKANPPLARRAFGQGVAACCISGLMGLTGASSYVRRVDSRGTSMGSSISFAELESAGQDGHR